MKLFGFSSKLNDEVYNKAKFESMEDAVVYFAEQKSMTIDDFLTIYNVFELK